MQEFLIKTETELRVRNYSPRTIQAYVRALRTYFSYKKHTFHLPDEENIRQFLADRQKKGMAGQTINIYLQAIKFFYNQVIKTLIIIEFKCSKTPHHLPCVLSKKEIKAVLSAPVNRKHHLMLALAYCAGLRVGEVIDLKVKDLDFDQLIIHIKQAKGNKDRISVLSEHIINELKSYLGNKSKNDFVFTNTKGGKLTARTAQKVFADSCVKANIKKDATFHSLRHSFATHLIEDGVNIRYIQELLGHNNIRTTQRYTSVTNPKLKNIKSPL